MSETEKHRLHAIIEGRVQGVGFRYFILEQSITLDLSGWVRNTIQGHVEVVAEGERAGLERLFQAMQRGPHMAFVTTVRPDWSVASGEFTGFHVLQTD